MKRIFLIVLIAIQSVNLLFAQKSPFSLEDIFLKGTFKTAGISGFNEMKNGEHYTELKTTETGWYILKRSMKTGDSAGIVLRSSEISIGIKPETYDFSQDEQYLILTEASEAIYRHSR
ncbi:MAG: hypothetical protein ACO3BD_03260, partial [Chitinophagaceae bacterium]